MASSHVTIEIAGMPRLIAELRAEMARLLRDAADDEDNRVAARLHRIADAFECGQSEYQS